MAILSVGSWSFWWMTAAKMGRGGWDSSDSGSDDRFLGQKQAPRFLSSNCLLRYVVFQSPRHKISGHTGTPPRGAVNQACIVYTQGAVSQPHHILQAAALRRLLVCVISLTILRSANWFVMRANAVGGWFPGEAEER
ncbi:hypothetical protein EDB81DRAFT_481183 [Dactylonectria macrodidyma]|uniref:Secreted protein n=1 Tax=Dactylonectria macrodidyma TaxID=307937 RepID=A0A9P9F0H1_9HYPO|nr:hypothetical protein EDB81DRAFT_481183 [Dactylonectria macrodidyma]